MTEKPTRNAREFVMAIRGISSVDNIIASVESRDRAQYLAGWQVGVARAATILREEMQRWNDDSIKYILDTTAVQIEHSQPPEGK